MLGCLRRSVAHARHRFRRHHRCVSPTMELRDAIHEQLPEQVEWYHRDRKEPYHLTEQLLGNSLCYSSSPLYCEQDAPETFSVSATDIRTPRRHAGEVCTRASKCMRIVPSGMSDAPRRSAHGMPIKYLSGERQNTRPYRKEHIRLMPINLSLCAFLPSLARASFLQ